MKVKSKRKKSRTNEIIPRIIVLILLFLVFSGIVLWILHSMGFFDNTESYAVVFILGVHRNSKTINFEENPLLKEKIEKVIDTYGFASIVVADGDPSNQNKDYDFSKMKPSLINKFRNSKEIARNLIETKSNFVKDMKAFRAETPEVDMIEALNIAARTLNSRKSDIKEIVILGTGLSTTGRLNFADDGAAWLYSDPSDIVTILQENEELPKLTGINVTWCQINDTGEPQPKLDGLREANIQEIWNMIIMSGGGEMDISPIKAGPGEYDETYPEVSVVNLKPEPPKVTSVEIYPKKLEIQKSKSYIFSATVAGINNPSQNVEWSVSGNLNGDTKINENGELIVAAGEPADSLIVTAASSVDNKIFSTASIDLTSAPPPSPTVNEVVIPQNYVTIDVGESYTFSVTVSGNNSPSQSVKWSVSGNSDADTKIRDNGELIVSVGETSFTLTVKATSTIDSTKFGEAIVKVLMPLETPAEANVQFQGNSSELLDEKQAVEDIQEWVNFIKEQDAGIYLFGCTAKTDLSNEGYNSSILLGKSRAEELKRLFVEYFGINQNKIITQGLGYDNPWHRYNGTNGINFDESLAAVNRKVVIMSADDERAIRIAKEFGNQ